MPEESEKQKTLSQALEKILSDPKNLEELDQKLDAIEKEHAERMKDAIPSVELMNTPIGGL